MNEVRGARDRATTQIDSVYNLEQILQRSRAIRQRARDSGIQGTLSMVLTGSLKLTQQTRDESIIT